MDISDYIEMFYYENKDKMTIDEMAFRFVYEFFVWKPPEDDDEELPF